MVEAVRLLLAAALQEPTNQRFQMVGDGTIPLFPPPLVYSRLMGQARSHIDACQPPQPVSLTLPLSHITPTNRSPTPIRSVNGKRVTAFLSTSMPCNSALSNGLKMDTDHALERQQVKQQRTTSSRDVR